jgi:hypothetical protein
MCIRISYHMRLGLVRYSYHTEYEVLPPRSCCTTSPGADNIRYIQYYFILVALASYVHNKTATSGHDSLTPPGEQTSCITLHKFITTL